MNAIYNHELPIILLSFLFNGKEVYSFKCCILFGNTVNTIEEFKSCKCTTRSSHEYFCKGTYSKWLITNYRHKQVDVRCLYYWKGFTSHIMEHQLKNYYWEYWLVQEKYHNHFLRWRGMWPMKQRKDNKDKCRSHQSKGLLIILF